MYGIHAYIDTPNYVPQCRQIWQSYASCLGVIINTSSPIDFPKSVPLLPSPTLLARKGSLSKIKKHMEWGIKADLSLNRV